jgi:hypothetical protein
MIGPLLGIYERVPLPAEASQQGAFLRAGLRQPHVFLGVGPVRDH